MLEDFAQDILGGIRKGLGSKQGQEIIYEIVYNILKPAKYVVSLLLFLIIITFILNISNMYFTYRSYKCLSNLLARRAT